MVETSKFVRGFIGALVGVIVGATLVSTLVNLTTGYTNVPLLNATLVGTIGGAAVLLFLVSAILLPM